ncbi:MAG: DUF5915 domain-containing protein, partial [Bacteroidota bacterium]
AMPFAQMHYPFENKELFSKSFPADFIAEGIDQTRGWFYTLHNIATALFDKPAYKNIIVNELILDENGIKMSKSKGNVVDPFDIMDEYGADAVRWYLLVNNPPWKPTLFSRKDIAQTVISDFFRSLTNTYAFFALYANIDGFTGNEELVPVTERPEIDRWVLSRINTIIADYRKYMDEYELTKALRSVQTFCIYELSNWYIRRNRRRFWKGENDKDKRAAYQTLKEILLKVVSLIAPVAPFLSEDLYLRLKSDNSPESVHLLEMPESDVTLIDKELERRMEIAQRIVFLARSLREKAKIRVRQPLRRILVPVLTPADRRDIQHFEEIIKEELNVRTIEFVSGDTDIVRKSAKANFKTIGKKFGKITQQVANEIKNLKPQQIKQLELEKELKLNIAGNDVILDSEDIEIVSEDMEGWLVASEANVTVALDTQMDEELLQEGIAREFVSRIQNLRKNSGFEVTDRISIEYNAPENFQIALNAQKEYIKNETLALTLNFNDKLSAGEDIEIDEILMKVKIEKEH